MATVLKIKKKTKGKKKALTPLQKKLLKAPAVTKRQIKKMEEAGKLVSKWKI